MAGGTFTSALIGSTSTSGVNRIAIWNGTTWAKLGTGVSGGSAPAVAALAVVGNQPYVGGSFTSAGGVAVSNVARWNGTTWSAVGSGLPGAVEALGVWNGTLYAGGAFTSSGGAQLNHVAAWNGTVWVPVGGGFDSDVLALTSFDDGSGGGAHLYAGGKFVNGGFNGVARWNATATPAAWVAVGGGVSGTVSGTGPLVDAFAHGAAAGVPVLYAGGSFTAAGGVTTAGVAQWQAGAWSAVSSNVHSGAAGLANRVYALAWLDDGYGAYLYAAGSLGTPYNRLAAWDGSIDAWQPLAGPSGPAGTDNTVNALAAWAPAGNPAPPLALYAGGSFGHAGSTVSTRMARWGQVASCADTVNPAVAVSAPAYGAALANPRPSIGVAYLDVGGGIKTASLQLLANGQPLAASCTAGAATASCVPSSPLADGVYALEAYVTDLAGNQAFAYTTGLLTIDTVPPQVTIAVPAEGAGVGPSQRLRLAWSDAGAGVDPQSPVFLLNGSALAASCVADAAGAVCTPSQPLPAGAATLTVTIRDLAGNAATSAPRHFTVATTATTVSGRVVMTDYTAAAGARVAVLGQSGATTLSATDGSFSLPGVLAVAGQTLTVTAQATVGGALLTGMVPNLTPAAGGTTDAGVVRLLPACSPGFVDGLFPGTGVSGEPSEDLYGTYPHRTVTGLLGFNDGSGPALYAWGDFAYAGGRVISTVAKWDGAAWHELGQLAGRFALQAADLGGGPRLYALGDQALSYNGVAMHGLAQWDGHAWSAVGNGVDGRVTALYAFDDGSGPALFVAGSFQHVGAGPALAAPGTARWNGSTWAAVPATATGSVNEFAAFGGALYGLVSAGTDGTSAVYRWSGAAWTLVRSFPQGVAALGAITAGSLAGLYVADGTAIERWNGTSWTVISPAGGRASAGALYGFDDGSGTKLYLAGTFCAASCSTPPAGVFRWDGASWTSVGVNPDGEGPTVLTAWNDGTANRLVAGGQFLRTPQGQAANGIEVLVGGVFQPLGTQTVQGISPRVLALQVWDDGTGPALYVAGTFSSVGGVAAQGIARWDGTRWSALRGGIGTGTLGDIVSALEIYNGALYAGGTFSVVDGQPIADVARWDGLQLASLYAVGQSLWRLPLAHFTDFNFSWTIGIAGGAVPLPVTGVPHTGDDKKLDHPAESLAGGLIEGDNQILGEALGVAGTGFSLTYASDRVAGRTAPYTLTIPLTAAVLPPGVGEVDLDIDIAGQAVKKSFAPQPSLSYDFIWNRQDGYGRQIQGPAPWTATVTYKAGGRGGVALESVKYGGQLGGFDARSIAGLGGWTLSAHHFYDLSTGTLYYGDGRRRSLKSQANQPAVLNLVAGTGVPGGAGDHGQARAAQLSAPTGLSVMHDGSLLIADSATCRVRKVGTDGVITTVAGTICGDGTAGSGDGGPATAAVLGGPAKAVEGPAPKYPIYIADLPGNRIRMVDARGTISTVAGTGQWGCTGNLLAYPHDVAVEAAGSLLIANEGLQGTDPHRCDSIVRLAPGGGLTQLVGREYNPDPATFHFPFNTYQPQGVAAAPDGSVYFTSFNALLRMPPGGSRDPQHPDWILAGLLRLYLVGLDSVFAGDGLPASETATRFFLPTHVAVGADGAIYLTDRLNQRVRKISPAGIVSTVAGSGPSLDPAAPIGIIPSTEGIAATRAFLQEPTGIALDPAGKVLYIADLSLHQVWKLLLPGAEGTTEQRIPSEDGALVYVFDPKGHHLRTETAVTGKVLLTFSYADFPQPSAPPKHLLTKIADPFGNVTTIQRGGDGTATAITAPFGQTTTMQYDGNGYLSSATRNGEVVQLTHDASGLLTALTDPRSGAYAFSYDPKGRLTSTADAAGGGATVTLSPASPPDPANQTAGELSAGGIGSQTRLQLAVDQPGQPAALPAGIMLQQTVTDPPSLNLQAQQGFDGTFTATYPDGTASTSQTVPDFRFKALAPYPALAVLQLPSGLRQAVSTVRTGSLSPDGSQLYSWTQTATINGRTATTTVDNTQQTMTETSPAGRTLLTTLDGFGRAAP